MDEKDINNQSDFSGSDNVGLEKIKKERDEYLDGWQRARADFINYKKDEAKRLETMAKFANESVIRELILVLDSFDLALVALEKEGKGEKGIYLIKSQLEDILKSYGLEKVAVSKNQIFNPAYHEAVIEIESDQPSGTIVEEIEKGYLLNNKLIRPARVKIAK